MKKHILKYLQGSATPDEKKQLYEWLKKSDENKNSFLTVREEWLKEGEIPVNRKGYAEDAFRRFLIRTQQLKKQRKADLPFRYIAAGIALFLLSTVTAFFTGKNIFSETVETAQVINRVIMGKENKGQVILPDGTAVWINANSTLIYPEIFSSSHRTVRLEGEGYFEVVSDTQKPFFVETGDMKLKVLGTSFDIKNYKDQEKWETVLLSGQVEITINKTQEHISLAPSQKLSFNRHTEKYELTPVNSAESIIWIQDKLVFKNKRLGDILRQMEYWFNVEIICAPDVNSDHRLHLTIRKESPDEIFKLVKMISPIHYRIEENKIYLYKKE